MAALKKWIILKVMKWIVSFISKRGLRLAEKDWPDLMARHLSTIDGVKDIVARHTALSTFRVKHPKEFKRLVNLMEAMQADAKEVTLSLNPPIHREDVS